MDAFRSTLVRSGEKLVVFAGRLEYEKGVQTVLDALPRVLESVPVRFVVAGVGTHERHLRAHVRRMKLNGHVQFLGFVPEARVWYGLAIATDPTNSEAQVALHRLGKSSPPARPGNPGPSAPEPSRPTAR